MSDLPDHHVIVRFGRGIPGDAQGRAMLAMEKHLHELTANVSVQVFKETMADDSKLRRMMTPEERAKL